MPPGDSIANARKDVSPTNNVIDAVITFNTNKKIDGTLVYNPATSGYGTFFEKVALHEIGHTMGLDHPEPHTDNGSRPRSTVMNRPSGRSNDSDGNMPTTISDCDKNAVNSQTNIYHGTPGGTIGGGGGGDCACGDCTYGCSGGGTGGGGDEFCSLEGPYYDGQCGQWDPYTGTCYGSEPYYIQTCSYF